MTVQFILPEATSFPKERKLHDRLFLVLLYNLLCKTFKDHSSTFAASLRSERNSLLQERCFPIASAKVGHLSFPCKTSTKKMREKFICTHLLLHSMANRQLSPFFSLHSLPVIFTPRPPFFARSSHFWDKIHLLRGVFLFRSREILARNLCLRRKNQFDEVFLLAFVRISTFAERKRRKKAFFHLTTDGTISKRGRFCPNISTRTKKTQGHHGKAKGQNQKANVLHGKDQAQASKRNCFSSPHPLRSKNTSRLSLKTSPLFATSSLVSLKTSLPRTNSHSILRAGHAPTRIYAPAHSPNFPFLPSPFTSPRNKQ